MSSKIKWRGREVVRAVAAATRTALDEIDGRIEGEAKQELYPGHGKRSGNLRRSIQAEPARVEGKKVRGKIGTKGVPYALRIHKRYRYIVVGLERVLPQVLHILRKHRGRQS